MINQIKINDIKLIHFEKDVHVKLYLENDDCLLLSRVRKGQKIQILCNGLQIWKTRKTFQSIWLYKEYYSNEYYSKFNNSFLGKKHKESTKQLLSEFMKGRYSGSKNPFYGKKHSEKTRKILSEKCGHRGEKNPFYGKKHSEKTRKILSEKTSKWVKTEAGRLALENAAIATLNRPIFRKTKIEKIVEQKLIENNLEFKYNKIIGCNQYDFIVGSNILIECHGDYWHGNPQIYKNNQLNERQIFKQKRDIEKKEFAEKLGYVVFYIWEKDIMNGDFSSIEVLWK